jgi:hypothetical protein
VGPRAGLDRCGKSRPHRDFFNSTFISHTSCTGSYCSVIIHDLRSVIQSLVYGTSRQCSLVHTLRRRSSSSRALRSGSLEHLQIPVCVRAVARPMTCFPSGPLEKIHEIPQGEAAVSQKTVVN